MRILSVNMSLDAVSGGGTAERTFQITRHVALLGHACTVLTTDIGITPERRASLANCRIVSLPVLSKRFFIPRLKAGDIAELVAATDVILLLNHWTILNAMVFRAARRLKKPCAVCPAGALAIFGRSKLLKHCYNNLIGRDMIRQAQAHIAIASNEIDQFADYGISPDHITLIPNGVDPGGYPPAAMMDFRHKEGLGTSPYVLYIGRLNFIKGPDLLLKGFIEVAARHKAYHLVFAGPDDGMGAELSRMAANSGLNERIHFIGYVGGSDKAAAYQGASFVVVPSRQEAMSIVVLEAGICGKAVLMTDQCGFSTKDQTDGIKVVGATVDGIRHGLLKMLREETKVQRMGERFRQHVRDNYTWDIAARRHISLFERVLREQSHLT